MNSLQLLSIFFNRNATIWNVIGIILFGLIIPLQYLIYLNQPKWEGSKCLCDHFQPFLILVFSFSLILIFSSLFGFNSLYFQCQHDKKMLATAFRVVYLIFSGIVFLKYFIQNTYFLFTAVNRPVESTNILGVFSMFKPGSFLYSHEMYSRGDIGFTFLLLAHFFQNILLEKWLTIMFIVNGLFCIIATFMIIADLNRIFSTIVFTSLTISNTLGLVIDILLISKFKYY